MAKCPTTLPERYMFRVNLYLPTTDVDQPLRILRANEASHGQLPG